MRQPPLLGPAALLRHSTETIAITARPIRDQVNTDRNFSLSLRS
jgi:hypothetical protein